MADARSVGILAQDLYIGYMSYAGLSALMRHDYARTALNQIVRENQGPASVPIGEVRRKDGTAIFYNLPHYISEADSPTYQAIHDRLWLAGALLTLGDELTAAGYIDKRPDLEMVRHLRNGVAHGNQFHFLGGEPKLPAHFTSPEGRLKDDGQTIDPEDAPTFIVTRALQGNPVLFDFMGPADVCDLFQFVSWRLLRLANGDPEHELFPQKRVST